MNITIEPHLLAVAKPKTPAAHTVGGSGKPPSPGPCPDSSG